MHTIREVPRYGIWGALLIAAAVVGCDSKDEKAKSEVKAPPAPVAPPPVAVAPKPAPPAPPPPAPPPKVVAAPQPVPVPPPKVEPVPPRPAPAPLAPPGKGWVYLGQQQADFKAERDRILVGRSAGTFKELAFTVQGAPLEMQDMVITFGNGTQLKPEVRWRFDEKTSSRSIDLPGDRRAVVHVDFVYRSPNRREGRAMVSLFGR